MMIMPHAHFLLSIHTPLLRRSSAPRGAALVLAMQAGATVPLGAGDPRARPHLLPLLLLLLSLAAPAAASGPSTPAAQRAALVAFYEATGGAGWASLCGHGTTCNEGWLGPDPPCNGDTPNWGGGGTYGTIRCDSSGSVTSL